MSYEMANSETAAGQLTRPGAKRMLKVTKKSSDGDLQEHTLSQKEREKSATIGDDRYPMPDKEHAKLALDFIDEGHLSPDEKAKVRARAHRVLGKKESVFVRRPFAALSDATA